MNCDSCRWYNGVPPLGRCRKNPPTVFGMPDGEYMSDFPEVDPDDWCGQWEKVIDDVTPSNNILDAWQQLCNLGLPGRRTSERRKKQ